MEATSGRQITPLDIHVGARVAAFRRAKGLSQTALAKAIGVTFQQVQKYERGANRIAAARLNLIARTLGIQVASLYGDGTPPEADAVVALLATPGAPALLHLYAGLAPERRRALLALLTPPADDRD
ncbi:XRE family transcriptional regulator [Methylobacterium oryzihabitans]|uniref:XRE family transcriptional regulator n=1 Tax=Methylobacterium oryzihabitans TaxID=2499852 RepID=A0A3S2WA16_9HYPH|nr:XRE family transcriptional regulator [Methylobacterium oryzihabitans]